jgi:hypothetical protein
MMPNIVWRVRAHQMAAEGTPIVLDARVPAASADDAAAQVQRLLAPGYWRLWVSRSGVRARSSFVRILLARSYIPLGPKEVKP